MAQLGDKGPHSLDNQIVGLAAEACGERPVRRNAPLPQLHTDPIPHIGEGHQAAERVIPVRARCAHMQEQIDLRRCEGGVHGYCSASLAGGPSPDANFFSASARILASGLTVSTRRHWKIASSLRPTRQ